jgi:hypothetical protein
MDDADTVTEVLRHGQGMGGKENRLPRPCEAAEQIFDHLHCCRIQTDHGFIDDDHLGIVQEGRGNDETLFHAVRVSLDQLTAPVKQAKRRSKASARS